MQTGILRLISTTGTGDVVTLAQARTYLGVTNTAEDTLITAQINAAITAAEAYLSRDIVAKQYSLTWPTSDNGVLHLYKSPIASVDSVVVDGSTLATTAYETRGATDNPIIYLQDIASFDGDEPLGPWTDVVVTFTTTGLQDDLIREGIKSILSDLYNKGTIGMDCYSILSSHKLMYI